ncbi:hypothetical protein E4U57_003455 [Claviceps arundinis]|uniref:Uncharacterized protein n=1 Tax=Claviceps arundinis TaxID=1623583 RepID=A0A9P7MU06_9HYPO|nr:hypothetical protein E4U57_003455 [Claviceps arundinis]KAG5968710.1 hypothetical protein E4U56_000253 [Claviceps arundinis]
MPDVAITSLSYRIRRRLAETHDHFPRALPFAHYPLPIAHALTVKSRQQNSSLLISSLPQALHLRAAIRPRIGQRVCGKAELSRTLSNLQTLQRHGISETFETLRLPTTWHLASNSLLLDRSRVCKLQLPAVRLLEQIIQFRRALQLHALPAPSKW